MNLITAFTRYIQKEGLFSPKDRLVLAVSGGVDSVVLCHLCKAAGYHFSMAHCNFQLRDAESDGDELFVTMLAQQLEAPLFIKRFDTQPYADAHKASIQVAARQLRYEWFQQLTGESAVQPAWLVTAHHADDNIETVLMNFFKGSGINGLKGILPKQQHIIRPLLFASKTELLQYAAEHRLAYREDSSNSSDKYTRNYFRNQLIPGLQKVFPQVKENLAGNIERFRDIYTIYNTSIDRIKAGLITKKGNELHLPVLKLLKTPALTTVLHELIKGFGFSPAQIPDITRLLSSETGKYVQSATHRILRNRNWLIISSLRDTAASQYLVEEGTTELRFPGGKITIEKEEAVPPLSPDAAIALLDAAHIQYPLILRRWKPGDYFYPLGMQKKKKLGRFFSDSKLSMNEKEDSWVVTSGERIAWVVGKRIDDRFKLAAHTKQVLKITLVPTS
jgi:tRNA(Ile)-lysidine synthase